MSGKTILVARPCYDTYCFENVVTMGPMVGRAISEGHKIAYQHCKGSNIAKLREQSVEAAQKIGADFIFFVDSDMLLMEDTLVRLIKHDRDIISGVAVTKQPPYNKLLYEHKNGITKPIDKIPHNAVLKDLHHVGFGIALIKMSVFEKIERPWFVLADVGEDEYFCEKARLAGFSICADTECIVGHVGSYTYTPEEGLDYMKPSNLVLPVGSVIN